MFELKSDLDPKLIEKIKSEMAPHWAWKKISQEILNRTHPFEDHKKIYDLIFSDWDEVTMGPIPAWIPSDEEIRETNIDQVAKEFDIPYYQDFHQFSVNRKEDFWEKTIQKLNIKFKVPYEKILNLEDGVENPHWLPQAKLNIADSCFNHDPNKTAITFQKKGGHLATISYGELEKKANQVANGLTTLGLKKGDAIAIDMGMNVESVFIYLGIVKAGMVAVSIADSFAADEIATRLKISNAKLVFTQDFLERGSKLIPLYEKVKKAGEVKTVCLVNYDQHMQVGDIAFDDFIDEQSNDFESITCNPDDATNILFSSGTTGDPKAIPWTHLTPIKCGADGFYHQDIKPQDIVAWPTNLGWMMGPWLIYAAFLNGATIALYLGMPTTREFGEFVQNAKVSVLGLVPSIVKVWKNTDCMANVDFSAIKCFSSTGECSNAEDYLFLMSLAGYRPVIEYCGGTEIGGAYITGTLVQPQSPGTFSTPALGLDFKILDESNEEAPEGELYIIPPSLGLSNTLLNRDHFEVYYKDTPKGPNGEVLRRHGDQIREISPWHYQGQGRADDTMNLGGIKTSSTDIERVINKVEGVVETAAIAVSPKDGGPSQLIVYAVVNIESDDYLSRMQKAIKENLNPLFKISNLVFSEILPRTASNKVMRRVLRKDYQERA
ncbi:MAG: AMP-dependent synthetase [Epsilonproteobacteria bacterium]|nr:MAG: AMP-dependent synthetase [Campylobacterota bacterium]RLA64619.1 MAG: AMP-dependent synthetase [Campylobacterota bacterium]